MGVGLGGRASLLQSLLFVGCYIVQYYTVLVVVVVVIVFKALLITKYDCTFMENVGGELMKINKGSSSRFFTIT